MFQCWIIHLICDWVHLQYNDVLVFKKLTTICQWVFDAFFKKAVYILKDYTIGLATALQIMYMLEILNKETRYLSLIF